MANDTDFADLLGTIRTEISALSRTVSHLAADTLGLKGMVARGAGVATRNAADAGGWLLGRAERWGSDAAHAAERGALAGVHEVQDEIEKNPLAAVLIAVGFGVVVGFLGRGAMRTAPPPQRPRRRVRQG